MTGTSLDALDAALVQIDGEGLELAAKLIRVVQQPLGELAASLGKLAAGQSVEPTAYLTAARQLGELHAKAVTDLQADAPDVDFVVAHGQTIWHAPQKGVSWQLFDPWPIVQQCQLPVCHDLRQADLVAGGQGAPITPISDWVMYRATHPRRIVNLGGICNVTDLLADSTPAEVTGEDIGPCNLLIDGLVQLLFTGQTFDADGRIAATGTINSDMYEAVSAAPFFTRPRPRTTGREDFSTQWVASLMAQWDGKPADAIASAVDAVARLIADTCPTANNLELILAGGGSKNPFLVERIRYHLNDRATVGLSDDVGIPVDAREAMAMAILGTLSADSVPITLSQVTGAKNPGVAGVWAGRSDRNFSR